MYTYTYPYLCTLVLLVILNIVCSHSLNIYYRRNCKTECWSQNEDRIWTSLFSTSMMMTPPSTCSIWTTATKMDLQLWSMITLPGYSWKRKWHEGDKGWSGRNLLGVFYYICLSDFLFAHVTPPPPPFSPLKKLRVAEAIYQLRDWASCSKC